MSDNFSKIHNKIKSFDEIKESVKDWQSNDYKIVFTNGCFDLLHYGHIHYLAEARDLGDKLIVGLNSAASVRRLKGINRPINDELTRQHLLAALAFVDAVVVFEDDTPYDLIKIIEPDILVKGGDWQPSQIVGSDIVLAKGGEVRSLPFIEGYSTTNIEKKIKEGTF
jgi:D-glycero-beta-D-manno-heptose 1-phosphate adenylyltransferase